MNRRDFLKGMLAAAAAPAIVKAENLMKIYVPKKDIILSDGNIILNDGVEGQHLILTNNTETPIYIRPNANTQCVLSKPADTISLVYADNQWLEISRSV